MMPEKHARQTNVGLPLCDAPRKTIVLSNIIGSLKYWYRLLLIYVRSYGKINNSWG